MPEKHINHEQESIMKEVIEGVRQGKTHYSADFVSENTYREVFDSLGNLEGAKVVDLGAGLVPMGIGKGSRYFEALQGRRTTLIPIDVDPLKVKGWRLYSPDLLDEEDRELIKTKVHPVRASAFELPFESGSLDGVVNINMLNLPIAKQHRELLMKEFFRVLDEEGFVIVSTFGYFKMISKNGQVKYNNNITEREIIPASEWKQIAKSEGFGVYDLPQDQNKIESAKMDFLMRERETDSQVDKVEVIEPAAFILRKQHA